MKAKLVAVLCAGVAMVAQADVVYNNPGYKWLTSDGYWNAAANWEEGHQPTSFQAAIFDKGATVRIPAATADAPFTEGSLFYPRVANFPYGDKLTIDGSGTYWLKKVNPDDTFNRSYLCLADFGGYFWGGEGINASKPDDDWYWYATNLVMTVERGPSAAEDGATLTLKQGFLNLYDPLGHSDHDHNFILFHSARANQRVIYEEGTHTRTRNLNLRGNGTNSLFRITGGLHEFFNNTAVKTTQNSYPTTWQISGGTAEIKSGYLMAGNVSGDAAKDIYPEGRIIVDGTGTLRQDSDTTYIGWAGNSRGFLILDGEGQAYLNSLHFGENSGAYGELSLAGSSSLMSKGDINIPQNSAATGKLKMTGGHLDLSQNNKVLRLASVANSYAELDLQGGTLDVPQIFFNNGQGSSGTYVIGGTTKINDLLGNAHYIGYGANTETLVTIGDEADVSWRLWMGNTDVNSRYAKLLVTDDAKMTLRGEWLGLHPGTNVLEVAGRATVTQTADFKLGWRKASDHRSWIQLKDEATWNQNKPLYVANEQNTTAALKIEGGTFNNNDGLFFGNNTSTTGRFVMAGGMFKQNKNISFANAKESMAEFQMTGGVFTATGGGLTFDNGENTSGFYHIGGNAVMTNKAGTVYLGRGKNVDTHVLIDGHADVCWKVWAGDTSTYFRRSDTRVAENARLTLNGEWFGLCPGTNRLTVADNATLCISSPTSIGWRRDVPDSYSEFILQDNARLTDANADVQLRLGENTSIPAIARLYFRGGSSQAPRLYVDIYGMGDNLFEVTAGDHVLKRIWVYQDRNYATATNAFRMAGGRLKLQNQLIMGMNNQFGRAEIRGGTLQTFEVDLGFGAMSADLPPSVLEISGGTLVLAQDNGGDCHFQIGNDDNNSCHGRLVMTGGEIQTMDLYRRHSDNGSSGAYFNGGKITQINKVHNQRALVDSIQSAVVGERGLTLNSNGFASYIRQEFTDEVDGDGKALAGTVTITGAGSVRADRESTHARTVVDGGKLVYGAGVTTFGRRIELKNGGVLSLAGETGGISCDKLVVGTATSTGVLNLDADDRITITGEDGVEIVNGVLDVAHASENGSYPLFIVAPGASIDPGKVSRLRLKSPNPYKSYTVTADGNLVVADRTFTDLTWRGGESADWATAANWDPAQVPGPGARTTFGAEGNKSVSVPAGAATDAIVFNAGDYVLSGEGPLALDAIVENKSAGKVSLSVPMTLGDVVALNGVAGSETELSGALSAQQATIVKSGSAKVSVAGENTALTADWQVSGGTLGFGNPQAFGSVGSTLELGPATLAYTAQEPATAPSALRLNTTRNTAAVVDVAEGSEVAFPGVEMVSGRLAKKGAGTLKFAFGAGDYKAYDLTGAQVDNPSDNIVFADSGDAPTSENMFCGMTVAEGKLVFEGQGSNETKVTHLNGISVGDSYANALANAELELRNLTFNNNVGRYLSIGHRQLSSFSKPQIRVLDGTYLELNKLCIGWGPQVRTECGFAVTGSVVRATDHILFAEGGNGTARVSVGPDGHLIANNYIQVRETVDAVIDGPGAEIAVTSTAAANDAFTWGGDLIYQNSNARGSLTFRNGGALRIGSRIHGQNYSVNGLTSGPGVQLVFDGGLLAFASGGTSIIAKPQYQGIQTVGAGLTVSVAEGAVQSLTFPIRGEGGVVKTGKGELVFTDVRDMTAYNDQDHTFNFVYNKTDIVLGQYAGETVVREGKLTLADGMLPETAKVRVEADGTLDLGGNSFTFASTEGAGTIANGSLTTTFKATKGGDAVRFENVALGNCKVDLPSGVQPGDAFTFAQLGEGTTATPENWKAYVDGKRVRAAFAKDGEGRITVTRQKPLGLSILVR